MILNLKVGAKVIITKNVDVSDGLTKGAMGTVADIVLDTSTLIVKAILVRFDYESIGQEAHSISMYEHINKTSVPIHPLLLVTKNHVKEPGHNFLWHLPGLYQFTNVKVLHCLKLLLSVVSMMFQNCILLTIPAVKYMCVNMLLKKWKD